VSVKVGRVEGICRGGRCGHEVENKEEAWNDEGGRAMMTGEEGWRIPPYMLDSWSHMPPAVVQQLPPTPSARSSANCPAGTA
jgi:hypothetical protein